jgi:hypothetical protein
MMNVSGWNWCHRCGHREESKAAASTVVRAANSTAVQPAATPSPARSSSEVALAFRLIPAWGWFLLFGVLVVVGASFLADHRLPEKGRMRATWSTIQVLAGLGVFLITGVVASGRLGTAGQTLSLTDLLLPDRLWVLALKRLPDTRWHICVGAWSLTAILAGIICVGGLTYWLPTKTKKKSPAIAKHIKKLAGKKDDDVDDDATDDEAPKEEKKLTPEKPEEPPTPKKIVTECVIVGYTTKGGELTGLLVATVQGDELHYAGIVPASNDPEVRKDLLTRFAALKVEKPIFPDLNVRATWVQPRLRCEVESEEIKDDLLSGVSAFKRLILPKKPRPSQLPPKDGKTQRDDSVPEEKKSGKDGNVGKGASPKASGKTTTSSSGKP